MRATHDGGIGKHDVAGGLGARRGPEPCLTPRDARGALLRLASLFVAVLTALASGSCRSGNDGRARVASSLDEATQELVRCTFDDASAMRTDRGAAVLEAQIRRALKADRYAFSVRAGRCVGSISDVLRQRDARARALVDAWEALLVQAQSPTPDAIDLERAIRHVGIAWRNAHSVAH